MNIQMRNMFGGAHGIIVIVVGNGSDKSHFT